MAGIEEEERHRAGIGEPARALEVRGVQSPFRASLAV